MSEIDQETIDRWAKRAFERCEAGEWDRATTEEKKRWQDHAAMHLEMIRSELSRHDEQREQPDIVVMVNAALKDADELARGIRDAIANGLEQPAPPVAPAAEDAAMRAATRMQIELGYGAYQHKVIDIIREEYADYSPPSVVETLQWKLDAYCNEVDALNNHVETSASELAALRAKLEASELAHATDHRGMELTKAEAELAALRAKLATSQRFEVSHRDRADAANRMTHEILADRDRWRQRCEKAKAEIDRKIKWLEGREELTCCGMSRLNELQTVAALLAADGGSDGK